MTIKVFSRPLCGACQDLKAWLTREGIKFKSVDVSDPGALADAYADLVTAESTFAKGNIVPKVSQMVLPFMAVNDDYWLFSEMFRVVDGAPVLDEEKVRKLL